jgi:hypothetical protein
MLASYLQSIMTFFFKFTYSPSNIYSSFYITCFSLRYFSSKTKLKEFLLASFFINKKNSKKGLQKWYEKVNSNLCTYLLINNLKTEKDLFYNIHIRGITSNIMLNSIFSKGGSLHEIQNKIESMHGIKDNCKFSFYKTKIKNFLSNESLISLDCWFKSLSLIKGYTISKTTKMLSFYDNLNLINKILGTNKRNNWSVLFDLLIEVYVQIMSLESDTFFSNKESCLNTEVPFDSVSATPTEGKKSSNDTTSLRASGVVARDVLFFEWHKAVNLWSKNSIFLIVDEVHEYIRNLYKNKNFCGKQNNDFVATETECFLLYFDQFRSDCRAHFLSRKEYVPFKIIDFSLNFPMSEISVSDYIAVTWDSINNRSEILFKNFPKSITEAFLMPVIQANVSYLLDLEHFSPELYNKTSKYGNFYSFIDLEQESCIKVLDIILEDLDLFQKEHIVTVTAYNQPKNRIYYSLREEIWNLIVPKIKSNLPMVCPPKDWIPDQKGNQLYDGGYLSSSRRGHRGVPSKGEVVVNLEQRMIDALNSLQRQSYTIDVKMLYYILNNYDYALKHFLLGSKSLVKYAKILDALFIHAEKYAGRKFPHSSNFVLDPLLIKVINNKIRDFFFLINLAIEYALFGGAFYLVHCIDRRFRTYPVAGLISTQGSSLSKSLFMPRQRDTDEDPALFQEVPAIKFIKEQILSKQTGKSFFPYISLILNNNILKFASVDVSSSGSQIYGAMIGDLQTLELTNFLIKSGEKTSRKDFYGYVLDNYLKEVGPKFDDHLNSLCISRFCLEDHNAQVLKFKNLFTRNLAKGWIMRFFFSQGKKARRKELYLICRDNSLFDYASQSLLREKLEFFETAFIKILSSLFPNNLKVLSFHKNIISTYNHSYSNVSDNKGYYLSADKTLGRPLIKHFIIDTKNIDLIRGPFSRSRTTLYSTSCEFDKSSAMVAIAANATQNRDAVVCFNVLLEGFALGKPIMPSHDAFVCRVQDVEFMQYAYYNNFKRLFLDSNTMLDFLLSNTKSNVHKTIIDNSLREKILTQDEYNKISLDGTLPSRSSLNLLIHARKNRIEILRLIESGEYIMNPYVLS